MVGDGRSTVAAGPPDRVPPGRSECFSEIQVQRVIQGLVLLWAVRTKHAAPSRPARRTRRPAWHNDYYGKIDLRTIRRQFVKRVVLKTDDNLFEAVRLATADVCSIGQLREVARTWSSTPPGSGR
jgi:hypothetical protein